MRPPPALQPCIALALALALVEPAGAQAAAEGPPTLATTLVVESCVSQDSLRFMPGDPWVMLEPADRAAAWSQMVRRYPALQQVGVEPSQVVLWRKPGAGWLYVNLLADPQQAHRWCFTASVVAAPLALTATLQRKYFELRGA